MLTTKAFGEKLQHERKRQMPPLTQEKLAEMAGISIQTLSGYEMGIKSPTLKNAVKIANAMNLSLDYLCDGTDESSQKKEALKIETLADVQAIFKLLSEKMSECAVWNDGDVTALFIKNCPQIAKYYKDRLVMMELLDKGTISKEIYQIWEDGVINKLAETSVENYELPF